MGRLSADEQVCFVSSRAFVRDFFILWNDSRQWEDNAAKKELVESKLMCFSGQRWPLGGMSWKQRSPEKCISWWCEVQRCFFWRGLATAGPGTADVKLLLSHGPVLSPCPNEEGLKQSSLKKMKAIISRILAEFLNVSFFSDSNVIFWLLVRFIVSFFPSARKPSHCWGSVPKRNFCRELYVHLERPEHKANKCHSLPWKFMWWRYRKISFTVFGWLFFFLCHGNFVAESLIY